MTLDLRLVANGGTFIEVDSAASDDTTGIFRSSAAATLNIEAIPSGVYYRYMDGGGAGTYAGRGYMEGKFNLTANVTDNWKSCTVGFGDSIGNLQQQVNFAGFFIGTNLAASLAKPYVEIWQSSVEGGTLMSALSETTDYWYRTGFLSSIGGQYGGAFVQSFTDVDRTTLVTGGSKIAVLTVAPSFRYVYTGMASTGMSGTLTGTHSDVTLFAPSAGIDLTAGVETDTGTGRLVVYPDIIVATALNVANSETAKHVAIDEGADFFGDYTVSGVLNITAFASGTTTVPMFAILSVTDAAADARASNDLQGVNIYWLTSTTYAPYIHQSAGGTDTVSTVGPTLNTNQPYSFVLERSGATLTLKVWNDLVLTNFAGASQVGSTLTWTGRATTTYRYLMPVASTLNGVTSRSSTFTLGGVQRQGNPAAAALGQATETDTAQVITLSEDATRAVAQASETDTAQAITAAFGALTIAVNQTTETDLAQAIAALQGVTLAIGQVAESDLAQSIAVYAATTIVIGQAIELDVAQVILEAYSNQTLSVGQVTETDTAQVISSPTPISIALAQASEIDLSLAVTVYATRIIALGQASETDIGRAITVVFGVTETWSINLEHPTTGLALTGLGNSVVKFEAYQESTAEWFNPATGALQSTQPTPLALLEDISGNHDGRYAAATTIGAFDTWMVLHSYWDYDAGDGRGTVRRHAWSRAYYNSGVELVAGVTDQDKLDIAAAVWADAQALKLIKTGSNKHVLNPADGTIKIYDDDNTTLIYSGLAYSDAAGTVLYDGTAAVHHTTRLV